VQGKDWPRLPDLENSCQLYTVQILNFQVTYCNKDLARGKYTGGEDDQYATKVVKIGKFYELQKIAHDSKDMHSQSNSEKTIAGDTINF
jgi:hypothetical protein